MSDCSFMRVEMVGSRSWIWRYGRASFGGWKVVGGMSVMLLCRCGDLEYAPGNFDREKSDVNPSLACRANSGWRRDKLLNYVSWGGSSVPGTPGLAPMRATDFTFLSPTSKKVNLASQSQHQIPAKLSLGYYLLTFSIPR